MLDEFLADLAHGHNIEATVFVQARAMYRATGSDEMRPVGEDRVREWHRDPVCEWTLW